MRSFRPGMIVAFCFIALALSSCAHFGRSGASTAPSVTETEKQAQAQFAQGRYKRALALYSNAVDKYRKPELRRGYARMGEQIKSAADAAYQAGAVAEAGMDYRILSDSGITSRDFAGTLSFNNEYLTRRIKACSKALMESGLMKYREEKLDEAIAIWEKALAFDPDNKSINKARKTAAAQLQQLKKIK